VSPTLNHRCSRFVDRWRAGEAGGGIRVVEVYRQPRSKRQRKCGHAPSPYPLPHVRFLQFRHPPNLDPPLPHWHISDLYMCPAYGLTTTLLDGCLHGANNDTYSFDTEPLRGSVCTCKELNKPRIVHEQPVWDPAPGISSWTCGNARNPSDCNGP